MEESTNQELVVLELTEFIQIYSRYCMAYKSNKPDEFNIMESIIKKLPTVFTLTPDIHKILNELAKKGVFKFIITLLSNEKIKYEDHGELITIALNYKACMNIELQDQLINLLLETNSVFYQNKTDIIYNILAHEIYAKKFLSYLSDSVNLLVIKTLILYENKRRSYTLITNIKLNWLNNLPIDIIYYVLIGAMRCIRTIIHIQRPKVDNLIQNTHAHTMVEYIFDKYEIKNIPIDIIIKCFYKNDDITTYCNTSKYPNFLTYHDKIHLIVSKLDILLDSQLRHSKVYYLCCILINHDCIDIASSLLKSLPIDVIKQYFIKAVKNISNSHILSSLIALYPKIYFEQSDINLIINTTILKIYKNNILSDSNKIIHKMLSHIDKPIKFVPFDIVSKLIKFDWYNPLQIEVGSGPDEYNPLQIEADSSPDGYNVLSGIYVVCSIAEANFLVDIIVRAAFKGTIIKSHGKYITFVHMIQNNKKITINFISAELFMLNNIVCKMNYLPTDMFNYINTLSHHPVLK